MGVEEMDEEEDGWGRGWMEKRMDGEGGGWEEGGWGGGGRGEEVDVEGGGWEEGGWEKDEWGRRWMGGGRWLMFCSIYFNIFYLN